MLVGQGSPDLKAAAEVADCLGTVHHEFHFSVQEICNIPETYDARTVRASTLMFLMAHKIKSLGVKMVFSGEGADEIFGGYLYFHKAPNKEEFHRETCREHILYRQKEQFSDGVEYSWIDGLKDRAELHNSAILTVPGGAIVACSTAKAIEWDAASSNHLDPSGRAALGVHDSAYEVNHRPDVSATR
ncbi:putative asparagine synthase, rossmann-like alpha/beta/alpha sandwich [Helianthus anomalus]